MNIKKYDTITNYFIDVDDICVVVSVINNKKMYVEKINIWLESSADNLEYNSRAKYQRAIEDIHNLEQEIEKFVSDVISELRSNLKKIIYTYNK